MLVRIDTGDRCTDMLLIAGIPLLEPLTGAQPGSILVLGPQQAGALARPEKEEAACLLVLYREEAYLSSPLHRELLEKRDALPYDCLPCPLSLHSYHETLRRLLCGTAVPKTVSLQMWEDTGLLRYNGREITLTPREFRLFSVLWENRDQVVPTKTILSQVWPEGAAGNVCQVYITYLRKKLLSLFDVYVITSVRGKGYLLHLPVS